MTLGEHADLSRAVLAATLESRQIGIDVDARFSTIFQEMQQDARDARAGARRSAN